MSIYSTPRSFSATKAKENEQVNSYACTTGMAAITGRSWCWLEPKSATLLLLYKHGNSGASVRVNICSN